METCAAFARRVWAPPTCRRPNRARVRIAIGLCLALPTTALYLFCMLRWSSTEELNGNARKGNTSTFHLKEG